MGSKFISTSDGDFGAVSDGSLDILGASLGSQNLTPGFPIKIDSQRKLYSTALAISDVINLQSELDATIQTPYAGVIKASDFETDEYFSVNDELARIENITNLGGKTTNIDGTLQATELKTGRIYDASGNVFIDMDTTDINFVATNLTFNGNPIGVGSKLLENLDLNNFDITGLGFLKESSLKRLYSDYVLINTSVARNEQKLLHLSATNEETVFTGNINLGKGNIINVGDNNTNLSNFITKTEAAQTYQSIPFKDTTDFAGTIRTGNIELGLNGVKSYIDGDFDVNGSIGFNQDVVFRTGSNISGDNFKINGLQIGGGVMNGISNSQKVTFANSPGTLMPLSYVGSPIVRTWIAGDMYRVSIGGLLNCVNSASLTITMLSNTTSRVSSRFLLSASTNRKFNIDFVFTVRDAGRTGSISSSGSFTYVRDNGTLIEGTTFGNTPIFNGTVGLYINAEAAFSENNNQNSIMSTTFTIHKIY